MNKAKEKKYATASEINNFINTYVSYVEHHQDSGNNYGALVREGCYDYHNGSNELAAFIDEWEIDKKGLSLEQIEELVLDNFYMVSRSCLSRVAHHVLELAAMPIGEIEVEIHAEMFGAQELPLCADEIDAHVNESGDGKTWLCYVASDMYWSSEIEADALQLLIDNFAKATRQ